MYEKGETLYHITMYSKGMHILAMPGRVILSISPAEKHGRAKMAGDSQRVSRADPAEIAVIATDVGVTGYKLQRDALRPKNAASPEAKQP
jgi:hypothetical protein